jgi:hypothetical protein
LGDEASFTVFPFFEIGSIFTAMTLAKLLYTLGVVLIVWALISGLNFVYKVTADEAEFDSSYTLKLGLLVLGFLFIFLGRRANQAD